MPSPDPSKARRRGRRIDGNLRGTPAPSEPDRHMRMAAQRSQVPFQVLPAKLHTCDKSRPRTLVHGIGDAVRRQSSPTPSVQARLDGAERQRTRPASLERVVGRRHARAHPADSQGEGGRRHCRRRMLQPILPGANAQLCKVRQLLSCWIGNALAAALGRPRFLTTGKRGSPSSETCGTTGARSLASGASTL